MVLHLQPHRHNEIPVANRETRYTVFRSSAFLKQEAQLMLPNPRDALRGQSGYQA